MKVFTCTDFEGHYPVGVSAVIVASDAMEARTLLDKELVKHGLRPKVISTFQEISLDRSAAIILQDGDY